VLPRTSFPSGRETRLSSSEKLRHWPSVSPWGREPGRIYLIRIDNWFGPQRMHVAGKFTAGKHAAIGVHKTIPLQEIHAPAKTDPRRFEDVLKYFATPSSLCLPDLRRSVPRKYPALHRTAGSPRHGATIRFLLVRPALCLRHPPETISGPGDSVQ
jgi:hypothetical protein